MWTLIQNTIGKAPKLARTLAGVATVTVMAVGWSGCGSGGGDSSSATPPLAATDTFSAAVSTMVATAPDDNEPASIDAIAETLPDDTEPMPVI